MMDDVTRRRLQAMGIPDEVLEIVGNWVKSDDVASLHVYEQRIGERLGIDPKVFLAFTGQFGMGVGMLTRAGVTKEEMHEFVDRLYPILGQLAAAFEAHDKEQRS